MPSAPCSTAWPDGLGEAEPQLRESLSQLRLAFVSLEGAESSAAESSANNGQT